MVTWREPDLAGQPVEDRLFHGVAHLRVVDPTRLADRVQEQAQRVGRVRGVTGEPAVPGGIVGEPALAGDLRRVGRDDVVDDQALRGDHDGAVGGVAGGPAEEQVAGRGGIEEDLFGVSAVPRAPGDQRCLPGERGDQQGVRGV